MASDQAMGQRQRLSRAAQPGTVQTLVCLQVREGPEAEAAAEVDGDSSLVVSPCSSLWRPRLMWLCRAAGVSHSLGRQLCRKGIQELK